jgi:hypothetical protein
MILCLDILDEADYNINNQSSFEVMTYVVIPVDFVRSSFWNFTQQETSLTCTNRKEVVQITEQSYVITVQ